MSDDPNLKSTPEPAAETPKRENALANLLLNVALPVLILNKCSKAGHWYSMGPQWALVVSALLPLGYFIWDWHTRKSVNAISILGIVSVLLTGGLGLLKLSAQAFAIKEAAIPLLIGIAFLLSHKMGKPFFKGMLSQMLNMPKVERVVAKKGATEEFAQVLWKGTLIVAASFLFSAVANYFLALYFLNGTEPGSAEYTAAIGKQTGWGFAVIGVPSMVFLVAAFMQVSKGLTRVTGLSLEDFQIT